MLRNASKVISIVVALAMVCGAFAVLVSAGATSAPANAKVTVASDLEPRIIEKSRMATPDIDALFDSAGVLEQGAYQPGNIYKVNESAKYRTGIYGKAYYLTGPLKSNLMWFTKKAETNHSEVWVQNDTTFMALDPRNTNASQFMVTDAQARYMANQFEKTIYPNETSFLGVPPQNDGENSAYKSAGLPYFGTNVTGRVMIMIFNIVDGPPGDPTSSFFNPAYKSYIAGFYSSTLDDYYYDRNIVNIDTYDWSNRTGAGVPRPFLYEGVIAHEYGHLLEALYGPGEDTFIDEGFSDFIGSLCGYPIDPSHIKAFLATPDNSLTAWQDQGDRNILADYGAAALFMYYLNDHFGQTYVKALMNNPDIGIAGVDSTLAQTGHGDWNFDKVFKCWRLANMIHSNSPGQGWYNYNSFDLTTFGNLGVLNWNPIADPSVDSAAGFFGNTTSSYGNGDTGVSDIGAYGTDYINVRSELAPGVSNWATFLNSYDLKTDFNGQDRLIAVFPWEIVAGPADHPSNVWWSGVDDLVDKNIGGVFDLRGMETATLSFDTFWDTEPGWDFGFVQISTDSGATWTSLSNDYTTSEHDPGAMSSIVANMPGLTGTSDGWLNMEFNLDQYVGQVVWIQFRYMTDPNTHGEGWYMDNVALNGVVVDNADDIVTLANIPVYTDINFFVTLYFPGSTYNGVYYLPAILNLNLNHLDETTIRTLESYVVYSQMYILVSPNNGPADYGFGMFNGAYLMV